MAHQQFDILAARVGKISGPSLAFVWILVLFVLTISTSVLALTASQWQTRLLSISTKDLPISAWQVEDRRDAYAKAKATLDTKRAELASSNAELQKVAEKQAVFQVGFEGDQYSTASFALIAALQAKGESISARDEQGKLLSYISYYDTNTAATLSRFSSSYKDLPEMKAWLDAKQKVDDFKIQSQPLNIERQTVMQRIDAITEQLTSLEGDVNKSIDPHFGGSGALSAEQFALVSALVREMEFIATFAGGPLKWFSVLPNDMLVLVLVVAMGVLGSTLHLIYAYFQRQDRFVQPRDFLIYPMLGAITSIVVFILLKAGVLVVTDSAKLGEVAPLNPFFISFLGIISGFLSENAVATIRNVGLSWFRASAGGAQRQWAVRLRDVLREKKTDETAFASRIGVDAKELSAWLNEEESVPPEKQAVIAAVLEIDARAIFSPLPPPAASAP